MTGFNPQPDNFAHSGKYRKFYKTHYHSMLPVKGVVSIVNIRGNKKWQKDQDDEANKENIGTFHNLR